MVIKKRLIPRVMIMFGDLLRVLCRLVGWALLILGSLSIPAQGASLPLIESAPDLVSGTQDDRGCSMTGFGPDAAWLCTEPSTPGRVWGSVDLKLPAHVQYISFDFTFTGLESEDSAVVYFDGNVVWALGGDLGDDGVQRGSGRVPVSAPSGNRQLMVVLYSKGSTGGTFEMTNLSLERYEGTAISAATLPVSRSVQVGELATVFGTIINGGDVKGEDCEIALKTLVPAKFDFQITNSSTNELVGSAGVPVDIPVGEARSYVLGVIPQAAFSPRELEFAFYCRNAEEAPILTSLSTVLMSATESPVPDVIALGSTLTGDQILWLPGSSGSGFFGVAGANVGAGGEVTVSMDTGNSTLPLDLSVCQQDPNTGECLTSPGSETSISLSADETAAFAIFVTASGSIPFDPANHRIFVRIRDSDDVIRGATSVAVRTDGS